MTPSGRGAGDWLTSVLAITPGPFAHSWDDSDWLERHGLNLHIFKYHMQGRAYFEEIEPGCMADAVERLAWLGKAMEELTFAYVEPSEAFWKDLERESDDIEREFLRTASPDEIVPQPERFRRVGAKRRMALTELPQE